MTPAKKFLVLFAVLYAIGAVLGLVLWGPPGLSAEYEEAYGERHEHYLEVIKNEHYKLFEQNPDAHPPDEHLAQNIAFAEDYEANEAFQAEQTRQARFSLFFEVFNGLALIILAVRFGKTPLLAFLDAQITEIRTRIETAQTARRRAAEELKLAEDQIARLDEERAQITEQSQTLAESTAGEIRATTAGILDQIVQEGEQRQTVEVQNAAERLKREIVLLAMARFEDQMRQGASERAHEALVEQFLTDLEAMQ